MATFSDMSPWFHLKHAWHNMHSVWGKLALVLFYSFLWIMIVSSVVTLIWPNFMGVECWFEKESDYHAMTLISLLRMENLFALGFLLYADRGGIRFWNVSMVFVVMMVWSWMQWQWSKTWAMMEGAPKHCDDSGMMTGLWIGVAWIGLAWIFSWMEHCAGRGGASSGSGTANESTPLTA